MPILLANYWQQRISLPSFWESHVCGLQIPEAHPCLLKVVIRKHQTGDQERAIFMIDLQVLKLKGSDQEKRNESID